MTLIEIITQALTVLNRSTDAQSMEDWKGKLTIFANDGTKDLANELQLTMTDTVTVEDRQIALNKLTHSCVKVVSVSQNGTELTFVLAPDSAHVSVPATGEVQVKYRYIPNAMADDIDTPGIPEHLHHLLVPYVVFREHMTADPTMQRRADIFFEMYDRGKREAKHTNGEYDTYRFRNTGWF